MTIDWKDEDEIVLGKDLKPGDCIRARRWSDEKDGNDMGIVIATTFVLDERGKKLRRFYGDKPGYEAYEINCPSDGAYYSYLDPEQEFKVIRSRKDILYTYKTIDYQLLKRSADLMNQSNRLNKIRNVAVDRMNNRLDKIKKEQKDD